MSNDTKTEESTNLGHSKLKSLERGYPLPNLNRLYTPKIIWKIVFEKFYPEKSWFSKDNLTKLESTIQKYGSKMKFELFLEKYKYVEIAKFVRVRATFMGVCFNDLAFTGAEDVAIILLRITYGKYCANMLYEILKVCGINDVNQEMYVQKTKEDIKARLEYLGKPSEFIGMYPKYYFEHNINRLKKGYFLISNKNIDDYFIAFTEEEQGLFELEESLGGDFVPWRTKYEKKYYQANKHNTLEYSSVNLDTCMIDFYSQKPFVTLIKKEIDLKSMDSNWSKTQDNKLSVCFEEYSKNKGREPLCIDRLLQEGKTEEDCLERVKKLNIHPLWTRDEDELIFAAAKNEITPEERDEKLKLKNRRSDRAIWDRVRKLELDLGRKNLSIVTIEEKTALLNKLHAQLMT